MIKAVVFDLDDTLYDEVDYCKSGYRAVSQYISSFDGAPGPQRLFNALWKEFTSGNRRQVFNAIVEKLNIGGESDEKLISRLVEIYRCHRPQIILPAESRSMLEQMKERYRLALLTDGYLPAQRLKVESLGIADFFEVLVYTEQLGREYWKPCTAGFEYVLEQLNIEANEAVYVGDNAEKDFIGPNRLGFLTIQLVRPARVHSGVSDEPYSKADFVIHNIKELPNLLKDVGAKTRQRGISG